MHRIKIVSSFSAAHFLRGYQGKCENLHGHNWKVEVVVVSETLDALGMVMDFSELKKLTAAVLEELDHKHLNELTYFINDNPSSENIARHIFNTLKEKLGKKNCNLEEVSVWETDTSRASYKQS
jgi:6-pyruvoyltetrahydropterin/6-carboxytetrahydropterin synthase